MQDTAPEQPRGTPNPPSQQSQAQSSERKSSGPPPVPPSQLQHTPPDVAGNLGGFLSSLLPHSFDTEDMIIILLLLLLGNSGKDQNASFLTLVLYLFL